MQNKFFRWSSVLLLSFLLAGCGMRFVYNNLSWLAYCYIDDYVDMNSEQRAVFKPMLSQWLDWHRGEQLPIYLAQLKLFRAQVNNGISQPQLLEQVDAWREHYRVLASYVYLDVAQLAQTASQQQLNDFMSKLAEQRDDADRQQSHYDYRVEHLSKSVDRWLGSVSSQQEQVIQHVAKQLIDTRPDWHTVQSKWQQYLAFSLGQQRTSDNFEQQFYVLMVNSEQLWPPGLTERLKQNQVLWAGSMSEVLALANKKQKRHILAKIDAYIDDVQSLLEDKSEPVKPAVVAGLIEQFAVKQPLLVASCCLGETALGDQQVK
ncbi:hypothetical protein AHAT_27680 [Agarivorans sp. Toyoura001]|uniref:DUF6279 family lipoprotein n=1 Tax=Agarivorans sp. Toyoura001 TaxID=2283141 RepID=UPI0010EB9DF3|nr:DUF6279 family lipoprotein [Agarivorans sp. Toyoura001]GDY26878.1 hypothetical protein AHAT_27680 [Agarivorans sp. Toyoura001]